jgi:hypothetical protein
LPDVLGMSLRSVRLERL